MITVKQESVLLKKIKSLSELEFDGLFREIAQHMHCNNWVHIAESNFNLDELKEDYVELERSFNRLEQKLDDMQDKCNTAWNDLSNLEIIDDDLQKDIDKIMDLLS
jgi:chromosome segregation ATPase